MPSVYMRPDVSVVGQGHTLVRSQVLHLPKREQEFNKILLTAIPSPPLSLMDELPQVASAYSAR